MDFMRAVRRSGRRPLLRCFAIPNRRITGWESMAGELSRENIRYKLISQFGWTYWKEHHHDANWFSLHSDSHFGWSFHCIQGNNECWSAEGPQTAHKTILISSGILPGFCLVRTGIRRRFTRILAISQVLPDKLAGFTPTRNSVCLSAYLPIFAGYWTVFLGRDVLIFTLWFFWDSLHLPDNEENFAG